MSTIIDQLLAELGPNSLDLLFMLTFMNPDHIGEDLLLSEHKFSNLAFLAPNKRPQYVASHDFQSYRTGTLGTLP